MKQVGNISITPVIELEGPMFDPKRLLPDWSDDVLARHRDWMIPRQYDVATKLLIMPIQSFLVRTAHHTILVDGCFGNHKERANPTFNMLSTPWLERLAAAGAAPEDIDFVMCTHLHGDHVGWNTRLDNGRWVPTFPNARYLFAETEWRHWDNESRRTLGPLAQHLQDSVLPVIDRGQADFVGTDHAIEDEVSFDPLPGHTPGHVGLHIKSQGAEAILTGDMMHHPIQCAYPDWSSGFCTDAKLSRKTRRGFLEKYADTDVTVAPAHFAAPTFGRIESRGTAFHFRFDD